MFKTPQQRVLENAVIKGAHRAFAETAPASSQETMFLHPLKKGELVFVGGKPHRILNTKPGADPSMGVASAAPGLNRHDRRAMGAKR